MAPVSAQFGTYALSPIREFIRRLAMNAPSGKPGIWMISILRKLVLLGHKRGATGPHDVEVTSGIRARLFPASNRCEKRAFAGVHNWDPNERRYLDHLIANHQTNDAFVFLDVGANVGFYSLFVNASGSAHNKETRIISVEPDSENRARLEFNMSASQCEAVIEPIGIAATSGSGVLNDAGANRGEISISDTGNGETIQLETLSQLILRHGLKRIDAMKVDIEGHDEAALKAMTDQLNVNYWPRILIVETGRDQHSAIVLHLLEKGYELVERTGINAILKIGSVKSTAK